jgi:hypothetical protein
MATLDHASRCLTSVSSPLIHRAAVILAVPAPVSLALRELASNRVPPAAPTAPLAIAASHHPARSAIGTCRPRAAWRIDTHPCRPNRSASPDLRASPGTHKRRPRMDRPASVRASAANPSAPLRKSPAPGLCPTIRSRAGLQGSQHCRDCLGPDCGDADAG